MLPAIDGGYRSGWIAAQTAFSDSSTFASGFQSASIFGAMAARICGLFSWLGKTLPAEIAALRVFIWAAGISLLLLMKVSVSRTLLRAGGENCAMVATFSLFVMCATNLAASSFC